MHNFQSIQDIEEVDTKPEDNNVSLQGQGGGAWSSNFKMIAVRKSEGRMGPNRLASKGGEQPPKGRGSSAPVTKGTLGWGRQELYASSSFTEETAGETQEKEND